MLDLMDFKEEFVSLCRSTLCESGPVDMEIEERMVNKAQRGMLNGLLFKKEGLDCAPTFYVEDFYLAYKAGAPIADLSHQAVDSAVRCMDMAGQLARDSFNMLGDTENLRVRMLNKGRNREYLKGIPFREMGCGFVFIAEIGHGEYGAVITDALMKDFEMTGDELLSGKMPAGAGPAFVLTNSRFFWGAGALFYPGMIERIHDLLGGDFYVLPSSVHELILIKVDDQDPRQLADLVRSANRSVVRDSDILADDLFICRSGTLCRVSYGGIIPAGADNVC